LLNLKQLRDSIDRVDSDIDRAIDRLDLKLLKNLMDKRQELIKSLVSGVKWDGGEDMENLIEVVIGRGAIIRSRLDNKLRLIRRELKEIGKGDRVRNGYLRGGGYGAKL